MRRTVIIALLAWASCTGLAWPEEPKAAKDQGAKTQATDPRQDWLAKLPPDQQEWIAAYDREQARLKERLRTSPDPRDWAMAAQATELFASDDSVDRDTLMRNASSAAPNDVLVQWWAGNWREHAGNSCSRALPRPEIVAALQAMEPDNGAVWMLSLPAALQAKDEAAVDRALIQIAASKRFDTHFVDAVKAWSTTYEQFGLPQWPSSTDSSEVEIAPTESARRYALALSQAVANAPSYYSLTQACNITVATAGSQFHRASLCEEAGRHIASVSNTMLNAKIGLAIVRSARRESQQDIERNRELAWLQSSLALQAIVFDYDAYFADLVSTNNELDANRRALERARLEADVPAWWQPSLDADAESEDD